MIKKISRIFLLLLFIIPLTSIVSSKVRADEVYYYWDDAVWYTDEEDGWGDAIAKAYAETTGLVKVLVEITPLIIWSEATAWGKLYKTVSGQGRTVRPRITYEADGFELVGSTKTITLSVIDKTTGETVGVWSETLPISETRTLYGDWFYASSSKEYDYIVWVYLHTGSGGIGVHRIDYWNDPHHVDVQQLYIEYYVPPLAVAEAVLMFVLGMEHNTCLTITLYPRLNTPTEVMSSTITSFSSHQFPIPMQHILYCSASLNTNTISSIVSN